MEEGQNSLKCQRNKNERDSSSQHQGANSLPAGEQGRERAARSWIAGKGQIESNKNALQAGISKGPGDSLKSELGFMREGETNFLERGLDILMNKVVPSFPN